MIAPLFIYIIIVLEGYIVLSTELLAIRQTIPFVGSGTDTVSILIAAVLMPLAVGYYYGGHQSGGTRPYKPRDRLVRNLCVSSAFLLIGLSTISINFFFMALIEIGITHRLILVTVYSAVFIVTPVYLLGQTVPLISNYFSKQKLSRITGKMLFFSTLGSFFGSIFSTLVLMSFFGVHVAVSFIFILISTIALLVTHKRRHSKEVGMILGMTFIALFFNSSQALKGLQIVSDNQYNTIQIVEKNGIKNFMMNGSHSSAIGPNNYKHPYITALEKTLIDPLGQSNFAAKDILVIGAGGFTFGLSDEKNNYTFVDIDPVLEKIATRDFLQEKLSANKKFVPEAAQSFINADKKLYDLIVLDAFNGDATLPEDLVTQEFLYSLKKKLNPNGILAINFIVSPMFLDPMSRHLDNTLRTVFPYLSRQVVQNFSAWEEDPDQRANILYYYKNIKDQADTKIIYTRDKNRIFFDKPHKRK